MPPAPAAARRPLSGLQKEVLRLYKRSLRMIPAKPPATQPDFRLFVRYSFRHPALSPRDVSAVEHALRVGGRKVEMLEGDGVKRVGVSAAMREWWDGQRWAGPRGGAGQGPSASGTEASSAALNT